MMPAYTSNSGGISYSVPDWQSTLGAVNAASPKPDYNALDTFARAGSGSGLFGMTPTQISSQFDSAYGKATAGYAPFPGNHAPIDQLQALYGTVGQAYDVTDTLKALDTTRGTNLLTGQQAANTAAQKFQEAQQPGQFNDVGASMLRANALLPFLNADNSAAADERKYADSAKQNALSASADIATKIAQLEQTYTDSLANYNSQKAQFGLNYAQGQSNLALQASTNQTQFQLDAAKTAAQIAENARQANLAAALQQQNMQLNANQTATNQQIQAANSYLANAKAPTGGWVTDNNGNVISGQSTYNQYQQWLAGRAGATGALANIAY